MEEALIAVLLADTALAALVGNSVFPVARPQGSTLPAIVLHRIGSAPLNADDGEVGLENARMQIDCWARTYTEAKHTAHAVMLRLSGFEGGAHGTVLQSIERDLREGGGNAAAYLFRASLDFIIWSER